MHMDASLRFRPNQPILEVPMDKHTQKVIDDVLGAAVRRLRRQDLKNPSIKDLWMDAIHTIIHQTNKALNRPEQTTADYDLFRHLSAYAQNARAEQLGCTFEDFEATVHSRCRKPSLPPQPPEKSGVYDLPDEDQNEHPSTPPPEPVTPRRRTGSNPP